jgi:hypothetical protein
MQRIVLEMPGYGYRRVARELELLNYSSDLGRFFPLAPRRTRHSLYRQCSPL